MNQPRSGRTLVVLPSALAGLVILGLLVSFELPAASPTGRADRSAEPRSAVPAKKEKPYGLDKRVPLTTSRVSGYPDPLPPLRAKRIFPHLKFDQPVHVIKEPTSDRLLVTERFGKIYEFSHDQETKRPELFFDVGREAYSLCFHPDYAENAYIYVFSNGELPTADGRKAKQNRIARFTVTKEPPRRPDPASERVILEWESDGHNGHFLTFGPDGMLWISSGDGTSGMDPGLDGQDVTNLLGTMLRIDVDRPAKDKPYSIPKDNPFVGRNDARPEIWAFGFRNPYRFAFDPAGGRLWVADIGQDAWEMIYLVERGGNYGWSIMEGPAPLNLKRPKGPGPILPPTVSHPHSEMRSITGGFFYRGTRFPELRGAFLYGDYDTRRLWAMRYDDDRKKVVWQKEIARTKYRIISLDEDRDREPIVLAFEGELLTLERTPEEPEPKHPFPRRLSESGLFASVKEHTPAPGVIPYSVNSPLWSDGADKERFLAVPGTEQVVYAPTRAWHFPAGSVLVKTFSIETEPGDRDSRRRIETRFLTLHDNGEWAGYTYRWNDEQTDAVLVAAAGEDAVFRIHDPSAPAGFREKPWRYPSRTECMVCHTREARYVLGLTTLQMNREHDYGAVKDNQLRTLSHIGLLKVPPPGPKQEPVPLPDEPHKLPRLPDPSDALQPLEARARSYLHANCWHCHVVNGGGNALMELHFLKSRDETRIYDEKPRHTDFDIEDARLIAPGDPPRSVILDRLTRRGPGRMPPLATHEVDAEAAELIQEWIRSLGTASDARPATRPQKQDTGQESGRD